MPRPTNRRVFCRSIVLVTSTYLTITKTMLPKAPSQPIKSKAPTPTKLHSIDGNYVAVNGWVMPAKDLTQGKG